MRLTSANKTTHITFVPLVPTKVFTAIAAGLRGGFTKGAVRRKQIKKRNTRWIRVTGRGEAVITMQPIKQARLNKPAPNPALPDKLLSARFQSPSTLVLRFDDSAFILPIDRLEMPADLIQWGTVRVSAGGTGMTLKATSGETIAINARNLRYLVDESYAAELDRVLDDLTPTHEDMVEQHGQKPFPPEFFDKPISNLGSERWK